MGYVLLCFLLVLCRAGGMGPGTAPAQAATSAELQRLAAGFPVSDKMSAGSVRMYELDLLAGQHARIAILKGDLILKVAIYAPEGPLCLEMTGRRYGSLDLSFTSAVSAIHRLEIRSLEEDATERAYELRLVEVTTATPRHRMADQAACVAAEAERLREQHSASSQLAALSKYSEAQRLWEAAGELTRAAEAFANMGDICFALSRYHQALTQYGNSLLLSERSADRPAQLVALNGIGYTHIYLGNNQDALRYAKRVLGMIGRLRPGERAAATYRRAEAQALNNVGEVYYSFGELRKSVEMFDRALAMWTDIGERRGEALARLNLGYSYNDLGDLQNASEHFRRSLALWQVLDDE
ncbi:MAG: tetratricopeptide repeat protein, partial [Blastocatellia bacterium]